MLVQLSVYALYSITTFLYGTIFTLLFLEIKLCNRRDIFLFSIFTLSNFIVQCILGYYVSIDFVVIIYPLLVHAPLVFYCTAYHHKNLLATVSSLMMSYFLTSPRFILAEIFSAVFPTLPYPQYLSKIVASILLIYPINKWIVPIFSKNMRREANELKHFIVPLLLVYISSYVFYIYTDWLTSNSLIVIEATFILFFSLIFFYQQKYFTSIENILEKENRNQILELSTEAVKKQMIVLQKNSEYTKILRHDIRHYASMVKHYAESGNIDKVIAISDELESMNHSVTIENYCSNSSINLLLTTYLSQLKEAAVYPILQISVPADLFVQDMDLCVILGNIMDNATRSITSCKGEKFCSIFLRYDTEKLYLEVQNSCEASVSFENGVPLSNRTGHGYGCKSIIYIAEKYHGICSFELHDNIFITQVILHE